MHSQYVITSLDAFSVFIPHLVMWSYIKKLFIEASSYYKMKTIVHCEFTTGDLTLKQENVIFDLL